VGLAYLRLGPGVFGKKADGTMAWYSFVPLLPYLLAAWACLARCPFLGRRTATTKRPRLVRRSQAA